MDSLKQVLHAGALCTPDAARLIDLLALDPSLRTSVRIRVVITRVGFVAERMVWTSS